MTEPSDRVTEQPSPADQTAPVDVTASVETETESESKSSVEEFQISGNAVLQKVQELIQQGNIRRILIRSEAGKTLFELPLTIGVGAGLVATLIAPLFIALGFVAMLAARLTIVVEKNV